MHTQVVDSREFLCGIISCRYCSEQRCEREQGKPLHGSRKVC